ncbi:RdRp [Sanxia water strider virus 19]|uniref:RdRp n=1 Tax=Sanxia water strider virus 19 TaxID=1923403 RepID=UPI00090C726D|nr:RdRp [Sanxia water strider virus 19]APG76954.1 RdRp [Sanxia water strider virus 19]APG76957.1 RdRp [Sanxia water strider virus 19]
MAPIPTHLLTPFSDNHLAFQTSIMDASNPVLDSSRMTIRSMMEKHARRQRQELSYVARLAEEYPRVRFGKGVAKEMSREDKATAWAQIERKTPQLDTSPSLDLDSFLDARPPCPVSQVSYHSVPLHPENTCRSGPHVSATRMFGQIYKDKLMTDRLLALEPEFVKEHYYDQVYSDGTAQGLLNRMRKQMSNKVTPLSQLEKVAKTNLSTKRMSTLIGEMFPRKKTLPDWHRDLDLQLEEVVQSAKASAGFPYCRPKGEVLDQVVCAGIPLLCDAIREGKLAEFRAANPEFFLCEVKNKRDRYETAKITEKTRPYVAFPAHFQLLFSCLSQPFTKDLLLFHEHPKSVNAYGFTMAHGGSSKIRYRTAELRELGSKGGAPICRHYGDDADIYVRRGGKLLRLCPDFSQMDGSVTHETVRLTVDWILASYEEQWGPSDFWRTIGDLWVEMATSPLFVVHGKDVWEKRTQDGLMTGVVGTTLFDTVHAALAYWVWVERVHYQRQYALLEEAPAIKLFKEMGLVVKPGTWGFETVNENPVQGTLWTTQRFLGVQYKWETGPREVEMVPHLAYEDWLSLLLCPRGDEDMRSSRTSELTRERVRFDRLRGMIVTGAFSTPEALAIMYELIDEVNPVAIIMDVQSGDGKGVTPDAIALLNEDFQWPGSEGVPDWKWCMNLYLSPENQYEDAQWKLVIPEAHAALSDFKVRYRKDLKKLATVQKDVEGKPSAAAMLPIPDPAPKAQIPSMEIPTSGSRVPKTSEAYNKTTKPVDVTLDDQGLAVEERTRRPTDVEQILSTFRDLPLSPKAWEEIVAGATETQRAGLEALQGGTKVVQPVFQASTLSWKLNWTVSKVLSTAQKAGLVVLPGGPKRKSLITALPPSDPSALEPIDHAAAAVERALDNSRPEPKEWSREHSQLGLSRLKGPLTQEQAAKVCKEFLAHGYRCPMPKCKFGKGNAAPLTFVEVTLHWITNDPHQDKCLLSKCELHDGCPTGPPMQLRPAKEITLLKKQAERLDGPQAEVLPPYPRPPLKFSSMDLEEIRSIQAEDPSMARSVFSSMCHEQGVAVVFTTKGTDHEKGAVNAPTYGEMHWTRIKKQGQPTPSFKREPLAWNLYLQVLGKKRELHNVLLTTALASLSDLGKPSLPPASWYEAAKVELLPTASKAYSTVKTPAPVLLNSKPSKTPLSQSISHAYETKPQPSKPKTESKPISKWGKKKPAAPGQAKKKKGPKKPSYGRSGATGSLPNRNSQ